jgi:hypothetical protein
MAMNRRARTLTSAVAVGLLAAAVPATLQHRFKAGSVPDDVCELALLPGKLAASPFPDRGTASPEFLGRAYTATFLIFGGIAYFALTRKRHDST